MHSVTTSSTHLGAGVSSGGGGRVRRKSSHNAIEKRYRSSINERILELKEMVAANDEKVSPPTTDHTRLQERPPFSPGSKVRCTPSYS
jgi:Helix-loop-helix DNA-binding domain